MKKVLLATFVLMVVIIGCSKEEKIIVERSPVINNPLIEKNMPLAIGNYWIYETYRIDTLGNETKLNSLDSAYIDRDTVVNGNTYFVLSGGSTINHVMGRIIRNRDHDIVNLNYQGIDIILFSSHNLGDVYRFDTINVFSYLFLSKTKTNPSFVAKNIGPHIYDCYEGVTELTPFIQTAPIKPKPEKRYYEKSIGVVAGQYVYFSNPYVFEFRLLRYHLN